MRTPLNALVALLSFMALQRILQGDMQGHRRWMTTNFSLTLAAVMLRLPLPASIVSGPVRPSSRAWSLDAGAALALLAGSPS